MERAQLGFAIDIKLKGDLVPLQAHIYIYCIIKLY